jgi:hypothetical protein
MAVRRNALVSAVIVGCTITGVVLSNALAASGQQTNPRQAINVSSNIKTVGGQETIGLGFANVSASAATLLVSLKNHVPLLRSQVILNGLGEKFRNGTVTVPSAANTTPRFFALEIRLPRGASGSIEVDLLRDFGLQGTPFTEIANIGFGL